MPALAQLSPPREKTSPYVAYAYSYPHKTAYRRLTPPRALSDVWADEPADALFLYLHIPFCEMRCGFCNLFTTANPRNDIATAYVDAVIRQTVIVRQSIPEPARIARAAVGGGTPTYLSAAQLHRLFSTVHESFGIDAIPCSVETSPRTAEAEKLQVLRDFGVTRVSIGVQSFIESEVTASARAQSNSMVDTALRRIRDAGFPSLNLDLIYGLPGQTVDSWLHSIHAALRWNPEELYLYPLYVRPLTGLDRRGTQTHDDLRLDCYRAGRNLLMGSGYQQVSMRMFRRSDATGATDPVYCCQDDGMIGLGCGARSYTRRLHYSTDYAVGQTGVREIIADYLNRSDRQFATVDYGVQVSDAEHRRRWVIKSLFRTAGFSRGDYHAGFGTEALDDFPELSTMADAGHLDITTETIHPTPAGLELSDALAPALFSNDVKATMSEFELR
jgi:oxygen-independent coproporphyrinogen-3 oxidase